MRVRPRVEELAFKTRAEFGRQIYNLLARGYPRVAGLSRGEFLANVYPLLTWLADLRAPARPEDEAIPFVIVIKSDLAPWAETIGIVERRGKKGASALNPGDLGCLDPIDGVTPPDGLAYLMVGVETGVDSRNAGWRQRRQSPLTVDEGIALLTHYPEAVAKNAGVSLLGSRCGDGQVAAIWMSDGRPKLGRWGAGNPPGRLGSASCGGRLGVAAPRRTGSAA
jgi:Family of unknown function (DUF5701)